VSHGISETRQFFTLCLLLVLLSLLSLLLLLLLPFGAMCRSVRSARGPCCCKESSHTTSHKHAANHPLIAAAAAAAVSRVLLQCVKRLRPLLLQGEQPHRHQEEQQKLQGQ
jgi:hypothetical protein